MKYSGNLLGCSLGVQNRDVLNIWRIRESVVVVVRQQILADTARAATSRATHTAYVLRIRYTYHAHVPRIFT